MDFEIPYTEEQQRFRREVQAWLEANIPEEMKAPTDPRDRTEEQYWFWREKHKELAKMGWLYPTYPKEYGGGGLSGGHEAIIQEEFFHARVVPPFTNDVLLPTLLVWATEEQKQMFLVPILKAEQVAFQKFTEPKSGAVLDGDEWVLNGENRFVTGRGDPDWLFGPMLTEPEAPRHHNLGYFMIPYPSPGLQMGRMSLVHGDMQNYVFLDDVRVPRDHLIGGDHEGWQVTNTTLEKEHGGRGMAFTVDRAVDSVVRFMQERRQKGESPGGDPVVQQLAVESYLDAHVHTLLEKRTYWMYQNRVEMSWEGPLTNIFRRQQRLNNTRRARDVMKMHTLLGTQDPQAPFEGIPKVDQRATFPMGFGAGGLTITKVIIARRLGISRTKERAAPTPATATSYTS